jgi:molybdate transport system substrate-binding protein
VLFRSALVKAKKIVVPGSTSGIYLTKEIFPKLGISDQISVQITERGAQATTLLANREANIALQPSSELINVVGIDYVGPIPDSLQLIQTFAAAITTNASNLEGAKKLIEYLSSPIAVEPIKNSGMNILR